MVAIIGATIITAVSALGGNLNTVFIKLSGKVA